MRATESVLSRFDVADVGPYAINDALQDLVDLVKAREAPTSMTCYVNERLESDEYVVRLEWT